MRVSVGIVVAACAIANLARAQEPAGEHVVDVVFVGPAHDAGHLDDVVKELLGRLEVHEVSSRAASLDLHVVVTPQREAASLVARAWFDLRDAERAKLYLVDRTWEHVLVREVPLSHGVDEIAREELGHILEAAVETLMSGGEVGRPREQVSAELGLAETHPETAPSQPPPLAPSTRVHLGAGAFWQAQGFSSEPLVAHGPGAWLAAFLGDASVRPAARLSAGYVFPQIVSGNGIGVRLDTASLRLLAGVELALSDKVRIGPLVGGGFDLVRIDPRADPQIATATSSRWSVVSYARAELGVDVRLGAGWSLRTALGADFDVQGASYYVDQPNGRTDVLDPWRVRPSLLVGLGFDLGQ